ncbi:ABC transporter permease [Hoeflea sp.]|uniref:ABC transporter permease n=1 Tax=Hoeflea sp. TaxID=1940281 RepID=UPI0019998788|nr:ABC transporter permease [Hoeflea sp.]MBC7285169.1 ABC transporter permease [Hoeflea sp.]
MASTSSPDRNRSRFVRLQARLNEELLAEFVLYAMIVVVVLLIALRLGGSFFNQTNLVSVLEQVPEFALFSLAMALAMASGGIDLSIIAVANLSSIFAAEIMTNPVIVDAAGAGGAIALACAAALLSATAMGALNGLVIVRFGVPPLVATLSTMLLWFGLGSGLTGGVGLTGMPAVFVSALGAKIGVVPMSFLVLIVLFVGLSFYVRRSIFGKSIFLYGENKVAALFTGLPIGRSLIISYALSGLLAGCAGLVMLARFNSMKVGFGDTFLLQAILVAVLSGMDPYGGRGRLLNVLAAVLLLQAVENAFTIEGFSPYAKKMIWGGLLLLFMTFNFFVRRIVARALTAAFTGARG